VGKFLEVIIPVHNIHDRRNSLSKLLSMGAWINIQFIVVSDSSLTENHSEVLDIVSASLNPNSKVVTGNFGSPGLARNAGLSIAEARWVCFLDSDDEIDIDALSTLISNAERESAELAIGGIVYDSQRYNKKSYYFMDSDISVLSNLSLTPAFTRMAFRRTLLSGIFFQKFKMAEDQCFLLNFLERSPKIYLEEIYFYIYKIGAVNQLTSNHEALMELPIAVKHITSLLKDLNPEIQQMAITMIIRQSTTFLISLGLYPNKSVYRVFQLIVRIMILHPIRTARSYGLILMHRPRSFV